MRNSSSETEKLDSLRAGLRVEDVDFKDAGTLKLIDRENAYWQRVVDTLEDGMQHNRALSNQLRIRRRQVLSGQFSRKSEKGLPRLALGSAAAAVLFIAVGAWWNTMPGERGADVTRTASIETMDIDSVDFANNIDFYTWLEQQSDTVADSGGS